MRMRVTGALQKAYDRACRAIREDIREFCAARGSRFREPKHGNSDTEGYFPRIDESWFTGMIFLIPLGFLALIGLLALLAIYLIKPSYQNKVIPSSYIWKESLKYRKKQVPASALRNVLIVICQILIIVLCTFIIAAPMLRSGAADTDEKIVIIDASADMRAEDNYVTRFERAVEQRGRSPKALCAAAKKSPSFWQD